MTISDLNPASLTALLEALSATPPPGAEAPELLENLAEIVQNLVSTRTGDGWADLWLIWATVRGELPIESDVIEFRRDAVLNGSLAALNDLGRRADSSIFGLTTEVEIVTNAVVVDVHNTSSTSTMSGIQRVVRETVAIWASQHDIVLVAWSDTLRSLRRLTPREEARMRHGVESLDDVPPAASTPLVVPNGGLVIVPELAADSERAERYLALGRFASAEVSYIGYDTVPLTSGETAAAAMASHFPLYLDAVAFGNRVAAISASTAFEFDSWKKMLPSSGRRGPEVRSIFLGAESRTPSAEELSETANELELSVGEPLVLVIGSHEPRKNHVQVLEAARALWEEGVVFRLVMIGAGSWNSGVFDALSHMLIDQGKSLVVLSNASDSVLSSSYRLADVSVFTSFHEGFGLPIVESLSAGTPVIASAVGSMGEIAATYAGVLLVDPHSDRALEDMLRAALTDPEVLREQKDALEGNTYRSWSSYADEVWEFFIEGYPAPAQ